MRVLTVHLSSAVHVSTQSKVAIKKITPFVRLFRSSFLPRHELTSIILPQDHSSTALDDARTGLPS